MKEVRDGLHYWDLWKYKMLQISIKNLRHCCEINRTGRWLSVILWLPQYCTKPSLWCLLSFDENVPLNGRSSCLHLNYTVKPYLQVTVNESPSLPSRYIWAHTAININLSKCKKTASDLLRKLFPFLLTITNFNKMSVENYFLCWQIKSIRGESFQDFSWFPDFFST